MGKLYLAKTELVLARLYPLSGRRGVHQADYLILIR